MNLKKYLGKNIKIVIDRAIGTKHPKFNYFYRLNYGFVPNTKAPDGEEIDAYLVGTNVPVEEFTGKCIAVIHRFDDDDDKLIIATSEAENLSDQEIDELVHFQEKYFKHEIIR